ncbi:MAG: 3-deoxy-manno-octulosonate cytidylyltransferase, partial [Proteobacteria bacterium]
MMDVCIIPARMGSSRFPGKPMTPILGIPMIEHVYRRTAMGNIFSKVYIATCDIEIAEFCQAKNFPFVMTSDKHERASD